MTRRWPRRPARALLAIAAILTPLVGPGLAHAEVIQVFNTEDAGFGSLRWAIATANTTTELDEIRFNIFPNDFTVWTINLQSPLPAITNPLIIDGYTKPGSQQNALATGSDAVLLVELNGSAAGADADGLTISGGGSTVKGLVIRGFSGAGIKLSGGGQNTIVGNFLGTDIAGGTGTANGYGIWIESDDNTVGGTTPAARNVISGNSVDGVRILGASAANNDVLGNYIGLGADGNTSVPNLFAGVALLSGAHHNTVGGATAGARNVIAGNDDYGVYVDGNATASNAVAGNYIGTDASGTLSRSNDVGVAISDAPTNTIGGVAAGAGNVISGNDLDGVAIDGAGATGNLVQGNAIGTDKNRTAGPGNPRNGVRIVGGASNNAVGGTADGAGNAIAINGTGVAVEAGSGNGILRNTIFANVGRGIDLGADGVTANDAGDGDAGPNGL